MVGPPSSLDHVPGGCVMNTSSHLTHLPDNEKQETSYPALLLRFFWILFGVAGLVMLAFYIAKNGESTFSLADAIYGVTLGLLVWARYLDIVKYHGLTSEGDRSATLSDWRCYTRNLILVFGIVWIAAHGIAFLLR